MSEITKQKSGKPEWDRILAHIPNALEAMIAVRKYGNDKYKAIAEKAGVAFDSESWRDNPAVDYLNSAARHVAAAMCGERVNHEDGGVNHLAQAMIDLAFAFEIEKQGGPRKAPRAFDTIKVTIGSEAFDVKGLDFNTSWPITQDEKGRATRVELSYEVRIECEPGEERALAAALRKEADRLCRSSPSMHARSVNGWWIGYTDPPVMAKPPSPRSYLWADGGAHLELDVRHPSQLPSLVHMVDTLSRKRRFADHCKDAISITRHHIMTARVAQWYISKMPPSAARTERNLLTRACLLHDLAEAMLGDTPTPRKQLERAMMPLGLKHPNDILTDRFNAAVEKKYQVWLGDPIVKQADAIAGCIESEMCSVGEKELAEWYDQLTRDEAEHYKRSQQWRLEFAAWTPEDDSSRWWAMWYEAGGKAP